MDNDFMTIISKISDVHISPCLKDELEDIRDSYDDLPKVASLIINILLNVSLS